MIMISKEAYKFLIESYEYMTEIFLNDPYEFCASDKEEMFLTYKELENLGRKLNIRFWSHINKNCSQYEVERLERFIEEYKNN